MIVARYRVTAGAVTVEMGVPEVPGARARRDVRQGLLLPADVSGSEVRALLELGQIEAADEPDESGSDVPPPGGDADPLALPAGMSVSATLEWVGKDVERARLALAAEVAEGGPNRATAVQRLEAVIAAEDTIQ